MKQILFAMLALAAMLPAMAENWFVYDARVSAYEDMLTPSSATDPSNYTFYLLEQKNTNLSAVKTMLEGKTLSEFLSSGSSGMGFVKYSSGMLNTPLMMLTSLPYTGNGIPGVGYEMWGVCVYQHEDVVRFQVVPVTEVSVNLLRYNTDLSAGSGYTSFKADPVPTPVVPEPATATLSLLALAGLAARRRRK